MIRGAEPSSTRRRNDRDTGSPSPEGWPPVGPCRGLVYFIVYMALAPYWMLDGSYLGQRIVGPLEQLGPFMPFAHPLAYGTISAFCSFRPPEPQPPATRYQERFHGHAKKQGKGSGA